MVTLVQTFNKKFQVMDIEIYESMKHLYCFYQLIYAIFFAGLPDDIYLMNLLHRAKNMYQNSGIYSYPMHQTFYRQETSYRQTFPFSVPTNQSMA